jgi:hypothetical protein
LTTWVSVSTSRPRAATSVAISRSAVPSRRRGHDPVALLLAHAAVQALGAVAAAVQRLGQLVDLDAGAAEHDGAAGGLDVEDATERSRLVVARHDVGALADPGGLAGLGVSALDVDAHGIGEVALGETVDARRHRGREQHGLAVAGVASRIALDVLGEAHVEHLVGLVEDHDLDQRRAAACHA